MPRLGLPAPDTPKGRMHRLRPTSPPHAGGSPPGSFLERLALEGHGSGRRCIACGPRDPGLESPWAQGTDSQAGMTVCWAFLLGLELTLRD